MNTTEQAAPKAEQAGAVVTDQREKLYTKEEVEGIVRIAVRKALCQQRELHAQVIRSTPVTTDRQEMQTAIEKPKSIVVSVGGGSGIRSSVDTDYILEILFSSGFLHSEEVAIATASVEEGKSGDVFDVVARMKDTTPFKVLTMIAAQFGMDAIEDVETYIRLHGKEIKMLATIMPGEAARRFHTFAIDYETLEAGTVWVAMDDPVDVETLDSLRYILKRDVQGLLVEKTAIDAMILRMHPRETAQTGS